MDQKPKPPFSESVQFIQDLFQEPESSATRGYRWLQTVSKILGVALILGLTLTLAVALLIFDFTAMELSDSGLWLPKR